MSDYLIFGAGYIIGASFMLVLTLAWWRRLGRPRHNLPPKPWPPPPLATYERVYSACTHQPCIAIDETRPPKAEHPPLPEPKASQMRRQSW